MVAILGLALFLATAVYTQSAAAIIRTGGGNGVAGGGSGSGQDGQGQNSDSQGQDGNSQGNGAGGGATGGASGHGGHPCSVEPCPP